MNAFGERAASGPRLMVLLLGLAVLPLLGVAWFAGSEYREVRATGAVVDRVDAWIDELRTLDELRLALIDEMYWLTARRGAEELGVPLTLVRQLTQIDLQGESDAAESRVDERLAPPAAAPYRAMVAALRDRTDDPLRAVESDYLALGAEVAERSDAVRSTLLDEVTAVPEGGRVVNAIRIADAATTARLRMSQLMWTYFESEFTVLTDAAPGYVELVQLRDSLLGALELIDELSAEDSGSSDALASARSAEPTAALLDAVDGVIDQTFDRSERLRDDDVDVFAAVVAGAQTFQAGVEATPLFDTLANTAIAEVQVAADRAAAASSTAFAQRVLTLGALAIASLIVAVALARYVGRPMVDIADAAARLGSGVALDLSRTGPAEVRQVGDALTAAAAGLALVERLEHLATHDDLTGVPSRRHTLHRLEQAIIRARRSGTTGALMFIDLDAFKEVNDTYGHPAGDEVLRTVAGRVGALLDLDDELGRYGGDEFVVIAESVESADDAVAMAERIVDAVAAPIDISEVSDRAPADGVSVSASVGVATFGSAHESADDVIRRGDAAVYEAKSAGRNRAVLYENALR